MSRDRRSLIKFISLAGFVVVFAALIIHETRAHDAIRGIGGKAINWNTASIGIVIHPGGDPEITDDSELLAIRLAFQEWQNALGGEITFVEPIVKNPTSMNVDELGTHRIVFDGGDDTGYFPVQTGIVALTPIRYSGSNVIIDADIVFNIRDHNFSTSLQSLAFDVRDVATHEIGHFLGLDHSPLAASSLFPYVSLQQTLHRSLAEDDILGARSLYKTGAPLGKIEGTVNYNQNGSAGAAVKGAHASARRADGRVATGTISRGNGNFEIPLEAGTYQISVVPLDGPMTVDNLVSNIQADENFGCETAGGIHAPVEWNILNNTIDIGSVVCGSSGPAIESVGASLPIELTIGAGKAMYAWGSQLDPGTQMFVPGANFNITNIISSAGGHMLSGNITVPANATEGAYDLAVESANGQYAIEPGALDVRRAPPTILQISPVSGAVSGGDIITITGTGFVAPSAAPLPNGNINTGTRVILGDRLANAIVESSTKIICTSAGGAQPSSVDVIVINPDGHEARKVKAFTLDPQPEIHYLFPNTVSASGGAMIRVHGQDFTTNVSVILTPAAGVTSDSGASVAASAVSASSTRIDAVAPALAPGNYDITITLEGGAQISLANALHAVESADPQILQITPPAAPKSGGAVIRVLGSGFVVNSTAAFGADPFTGEGGTPATVNYISATELEVTVPASAETGESNILIKTPAGQTNVAPGFTYTADSSINSQNGSGGGGGGGGGCAGVAIGLSNRIPPGNANGAILSFALLLIVAAAIRLRSMHAAAARC
ncbi:MAG: IPT/TIG domain-containing protein [Planctomycetota bacterium]